MDEKYDFMTRVHEQIRLWLKYYINLLKMYSQLFFQNLNDFFRELLPSYSNKDLEYLIYEELKSD